MKFTSFLIAILSATAVTAYEHNTKSMLRGVDTKAHAADGVPVSSPTVHAGIPVPDRVDPPVCRDNDDCPSYASYCDPDSDCSEYQSQGKKKCCVSPDEEDTLSKKAEAMEKVAKVLPLLKDAAKVKSDAMVKEDDNSMPAICECAAGDCKDGYDCVVDEVTCDKSCVAKPAVDPAPAPVDPVPEPATTTAATSAVACGGEIPCDSKNCPNSRPNCENNFETCKATCSATSLKLKDAAKVKSDAMVKEDDNSTPLCECDLACRDGDTCVFVDESRCEKSCVAKPAVDPAPVDPVPEPATTTVATAAAACGGENPCDSKNCPNSRPICTNNYETCKATCSAN